VDKKILLAVDESIYSKYAIVYASKFASMSSRLNFVLFHVLPAISQYMIEEAETDFSTKAELRKIVKKNEEKAKNFMANYKEQMVRMGIREDRIEIVTHPRMMGYARDILERAQKSLFDAICIGRRGLTRLQAAFSTSVSKKLLQHSQLIPVWVVDGEVKSNKIMAAVDGSESSLRAIDHLCFMLMGNPEVHITLFHVAAKIGDYCEIDFNDAVGDLEKLVIEGDKRCVQNFFTHAVRKFRESGLSDDQIKIKEVQPRMNVGRAIIEESVKGGYGTVVIGRRGISKSFFMGSVSENVIDKIENRALWLVS
jgi:nucleotide-binding universal stress UspA family protein